MLQWAPNHLREEAGGFRQPAESVHLKVSYRHVIKRKYKKGQAHCFINLKDNRKIRKHVNSSNGLR